MCQKECNKQVDMSLRWCTYLCVFVLSGHFRLNSFSFPCPGSWPVSPTWPPRPGTRPRSSTCWSAGRTKTQGWTLHGGKTTEFISPSRTRTSRIPSLWVSPVRGRGGVVPRTLLVGPGGTQGINHSVLCGYRKIISHRLVWWKCSTTLEPEEGKKQPTACHVMSLR